MTVVGAFYWAATVTGWALVAGPLLATDAALRALRRRTR